MGPDGSVGGAFDSKNRTPVLLAHMLPKAREPNNPSASAHADDRAGAVAIDNHANADEDEEDERTALALDFVRRVDELVWRRSTQHGAPWGALDPVYSHENVIALMDRLVLWESLVRGPSPRPP